MKTGLVFGGQVIFSGPVLLAHNVIQLAPPVPVKVAELAVLVAVGMLFLVLQPQLD
jgi:hypothetical protein